MFSFLEFDDPFDDTSAFAAGRSFAFVGVELSPAIVVPLITLFPAVVEGSVALFSCFNVPAHSLLVLCRLFVELCLSVCYFDL
jgi:hypothetical protein